MKYYLAIYIFLYLSVCSLSYKEYAKFQFPFKIMQFDLLQSFVLFAGMALYLFEYRLQWVQSIWIYIISIAVLWQCFMCYKEYQFFKNFDLLKIEHLDEQVHESAHIISDMAHKPVLWFILYIVGFSLFYLPAYFINYFYTLM